MHCTPAKLASLWNCSYFRAFQFEAAVLLLGYPCRYSHGSHFHCLQVSAAQSHFVTDLLTLYTKLLLFTFCPLYLASLSFPSLPIISHRYLLISPPPTREEILWSFYCLVHCCIQGAQNNSEMMFDKHLKWKKWIQHLNKRLKLHLKIKLDLISLLGIKCHDFICLWQVKL